MKENSDKFPIGKMTEVLKVCRSGYYKYLSKTSSRREEENNRLLEKIKKAHHKSRGLYGSPKIFQMLRKEGEKCSRKRVAKLMKKALLQSKIRKKWEKKGSFHKVVPSPNLLNQCFQVERANRIWVSDITYVYTEEGWLYVAVTLDLFSRKVVGLSMGKSLETELVIKALKQALYERDVKEKITHHSDRGSQYTSKEFKELIERHGLELSMSGKGCCYDNAVAESFFHLLKTEHTSRLKFKTREEAKNSIFEYIEVFYNRMRIHSTLGYMSPQEYENLYQNKWVGVA